MNTLAHIHGCQCSSSLVKGAAIYLPKVPTLFFRVNVGVVHVLAKHIVNDLELIKYLLAHRTHLAKLKVAHTLHNHY